MNSRGSRNLKRRSLLGESCAVAPGLFVACVVVTMRLSLSVGLQFNVAAGLSVVTFVFASWIAGYTPQSLRFRGVRRESILALVVFVVTAYFLWVRVADRSLLWPHAVGVDQAHHGALVAYLVERGRLPTADPALGGLSAYPVGAHLLAALVARLFGLNAISAVWLVAMVMVALQASLIVWCVRQCSRTGRWTGAMIALSLWIVGWKAGVHMVSHSFFFSQAVSVTISLTGVALCLRRSGGLRLGRQVLLVGLFSLATYFVYPQGAVVLPLVVLLSCSRSTYAWLRNQTILVRVVLVLNSLAAAIIALRWASDSPYFTRAAIGGSGEGVVTKLDLGLFGGPWAAGLLLFGIVTLCWTVRSSRTSLVIFAAIVGPGLTAALLGLLRLFGIPVTDYRIVKNVFTVFPYLILAAGVAVDRTTERWIVRRRDDVKIGWASASQLTAGLLLLVTVSRPQMLRATSVDLVDRDAFMLATEIRKVVNPNDVAISGDMLGPYTIWWAGLRRDASYEWTNMIPRMAIYDSWPNGIREKFLLADTSVASRYLDRPGVVVVRRLGGAVLLRRSDDL